MKSFKARLVTNTSMTTKAASSVTATAEKFKSNITFCYEGKTADAKSIINLMALGINAEAKFELTTEGEDEESAISTLKELLLQLEIIRQ
ncbi:MAG: HPr family phosphocarrier protein [Mycoplasmataceae bacterium]|jgi:phosphocarrier protein|nr:HPr family phosphocarrier protein [Mycoplasmataceae bacterium]